MKDYIENVCAGVAGLTVSIVMLPVMIVTLPFYAVGKFFEKVLK